MIYEAISLIIVALLWGGTNPLIKRSSKGIEKIKAKTKLVQFILEVKYLVTNWKYIVSFLLNQMGSILYVVLLQSSALSLVVPVSNSLTFVFTALSGQLLGETPATKKTYMGMVLILAGTTLCVMDKM